LCNSFSHSKPLFFSSSLMSANAWRSHFQEPEFRRTEGTQTLGNLILEIPLWEKLPGASLPHYHLWHAHQRMPRKHLTHQFVGDFHLWVPVGKMSPSRRESHSAPADTHQRKILGRVGYPAS
jgi:hypothetical protein